MNKQFIVSGRPPKKSEETQVVSGPLTDAQLRATPVPVSGTVTLSSAITGIANGRTIVTTAGTRVVLASSTLCKRVTIVAETDNTGVIVVGGTAVVAALATRQGVPLFAGDTYEFEIDNLTDINIDATVSGDGVTFSYFS